MGNCLTSGMVIMRAQPSVVEILVNPFCMAHRDVDSIRRVCDTHGVQIKVYNLWEIEDEHISVLPDYIASLIQEWRSGQRPCSVYSNVFVDGKRIPLNAWKEHLRTVAEAIARSQQEGSP